MNKEYALKLLKEKINGNRVITYEQIVELTGYSKRHLIRLSKDIKNKDIDSMLIHASTGEPSHNSHPLREPSPRRGILIMIDGTPHDWFENGKKFSLHLAIDDATGEILAGWFMPTECLI